VIVQLALAAAITFAPPVEDFQLPTCAIGEEAQPFEEGYVCGPADPAVPELEIPSPGPVFTAEPAPWPGPTETAAAPTQPAATTHPTAPATAPPALAETGVAEERITALAVFAAIAIALGVGIVLALMLRRRPSRDSSLDRLRDKNGYYTKLKQTDPGYPYGQSEHPSTAPLLPIDFPAEILQLRDDSGEGVLGVRESDGQQDFGLRIVADVAEDLHGAAAAAERGTNLPRLRARRVDVTHETSPSVQDVEPSPSTSSDQTVGDTADTSASTPSGSRDVGGRGAAASSGPAAPHFTQGGAQ
jgi:hypothetical protein